MKYILLFLFIGSIGATLREKAKQIYVGTAATVQEISDSQAYAMAGKEFNMFTIGNELKWDAVEAVRGVKNYAPADQLLKYCQQNNMKIRGHTLVWHGQLPRWVNDSLSKADLHSAMESRIKDEVGRYKGKFYAWDVVNEAFEWNGTLRVNSTWTKHFGESFIPDAFRLAHAADPDAKLYINDFNIEPINQQSTGLYNLVKKFRSQGVPIHGVGFQTHLNINNFPPTFQANLQRFVDMGVEVAITEMDVKLKLPSDQAAYEAQAKVYSNVVKACVAVKGCKGVTFWGFTDKHSWIPSVSPGYGDALLWDKNYKPKPAVDAVAAALK